uniref:Unclassified n=1 Tax=Fusarium culmorum CS7071 TaxID=1318462 RepID=A0A060QQS1_FUSCU|nr:unclassified [Fusarium culmorum CS7071]
MWGTPHHSVDHGVGGPPGGYALFFFYPWRLTIRQPNASIALTSIDYKTIALLLC